MNQFNRIFSSQIPQALAKYPNLKVKITDSGQQYLKGTLDVVFISESYRKSFLVEISCPQGYPYLFPILKEVGGLIPACADWHKYPDDRCCITILPDEIIKCADCITIVEFIDNYAIPYLASQCHKMEFGNYINEYSHGERGLYEYYTGLFQTKDKALWVRAFEVAFDNDKPERDRLCFCGGNRSYLHCHKNAIDALKILGEKLIVMHMKSISHINE